MDAFAESLGSQVLVELKKQGQEDVYPFTSVQVCGVYNSDEKIKKINSRIMYPLLCGLVYLYNHVCGNLSIHVRVHNVIYGCGYSLI